MITEEQIRKFTRATKDEAEKIGILVKMPARSQIADIHMGHTFSIDVLAYDAFGAVVGAQVQINEAEMKVTSHDEFFRMLNRALRNVHEYRAFSHKQKATNPDGDLISDPSRETEGIPSQTAEASDSQESVTKVVPLPVR